MTARTKQSGALSLPVAITISAFTLALVLVSLQRAYATVTVPNATRFTVSVAASGVSGNFTLPTTNYPIYLAGTTTTVGYRGTGSVTITRASTSPAVTSWSGVNADNGNGDAGVAISNWTSGAGAKIVEVGFVNANQLESGSSGPDTFRVRNNTTVAQTVAVLEVY